jgi:hypothetical protein
MADRMVFFRMALATGAADSLDAIDGTDRGDGNPLQDLDLAFTIDSSIFYVHQLDADSAAAESSPDVVKPDTNAGDKRWILLAKVEDISAYVAKAAYNAYTILYADSDDTPVPLTVSASTVVGRAAAGGIVALTKSDLLTLLNVADGANAYTHPNHSGDVTSAADGAQTIAAKAVHVSMLADGTDGELITWGADGVAATVAAGDAGEVLTSNGAGAAPTFETAYVHPTGDGNLHVPANSTTNNGKVLTASASAGTYTWETPAGGSGHIIEEETTPLTARASLRFTGAGVTATDDAGNNVTIVTIPGGAGGGGDFLVCQVFT